MSAQRYTELDLLRTLAIILMVIYHLAFDLAVWYGWSIPIYEGGWLLMARVSASLFLLLVGVSFVVAHQRAKAKGRVWRRTVRRACLVLGGALLTSVVTHILIPDQYIRFGVLHLIGVSILLLPFFMRLREWNILLGIAIFSIGQFTVGTHGPLYLLPLGFTFPGYRTIDYYPLLPWFGVILFGAGIGYFVYVRHLSWRKPLEHILPPLRMLTWPGRHALIVYLLHQALLFAGLWMVLGKPGA